ncbi:MAG: sensor histidine kinase, partial [Verrucomicrobiota bacterium]
YAKGFSEIRISTSARAGVIVVTIEDDGCGIPPADLPHIFERFYRVDKGRSRELGGTGLGLSIVKHIVRMHGGEVSANSVEGEGTHIEFTLPDTRGEAVRATPAQMLKQSRVENTTHV